MAIRGSSILAPAAAMLFFILLQLQYEAIHSASVTYLVGDEEGWDPVTDMEGWTKGKNFHAGDILEFKYDRGFDVSVVNKEGHDNCFVNAEAKQFSTGDDKIQLAFGANYFIDSKPALCAAGMKMAINATAPPPSV
ncbi:hypothetical protein PTKIN_Ptkin10aG0177000 [Pterospermum kingtungense]